ncbi:MAG TPA: hypothetical protein VLC48_07420 [Gemmatimonadota bacterium]|nr:hypothetical protein [Gemmatimonadota bacterium]
MFGKAFRVALPFLLLALTLAPVAAGQSAAEVLETAIARFDDRMAGIDNYTVVMDVMGFEVTNYFEKETVDGRTTFVLKDRSGSNQQGAGMFYNGFMEVVDRADLKGKESIDGYDCFVVTVDDFSGVDFDPETPDDQEDFRPKHGTFFLDSGDYLIRKVEMDGEFRRDGDWQSITMEIDFKDYREVDGMIHPFLSEMNVTGMNNAMSEEEIEEARKQLDEYKRQLAEMPDAQRAAVQRMMGSRMEEVERMLNSGSMQVTTQVKELKVNAGPPN